MSEGLMFKIVQGLMSVLTAATLTYVTPNCCPTNCDYLN